MVNHSPTSGKIVVVIGADDIVRTGAAALLRADLSISEVVTLGSDDATRFERWGEVHAVLVDAVDPAGGLDQVIGAALITHIRSVTNRSHPRIVAIAEAMSSGAVTRRLWEAGVDHQTTRCSIADPLALRAVLLHESSAATEPPTGANEDQYCLGITPATRVNLGVIAAFAEHLVPGAGWVGPRGRERLARRRRFNEAARLQPMGSDGRIPDRSQKYPSLLQIQRFVTWATQVTAPSLRASVTIVLTDQHHGVLSLDGHLPPSFTKALDPASLAESCATDAPASDHEGDHAPTSEDVGGRAGAGQRGR